MACAVDVLKVLVYIFLPIILLFGPGLLDEVWVSRRCDCRRASNRMGR